MPAFKSLIILLTLLFLTIGTMAQDLLRKPYTPSFKSGTIKSFVKDIRKRTGISVSFSTDVINEKKKVKLTGNEKTVNEVLNTILSEFSVTLLEHNDRILIVPAPGAPSALIEKTTINGYVKDSSSGEVLIGATVYFPELGIGTAANIYGYYSITIPSGNYKMNVSYIGYDSRSVQVIPRKHIRQDIILPNAAGLEEVEITSLPEKVNDHQRLTPKDIDRYPALLGDNDVMRALQHMPGVQSGSDATVGLIVRGGDPGQNLNLLDGVPLYYIDHFYGVSSVFNTDALKAIDFYSGSFPARYGGRLSSIIDVNTKDGDMEHYGGVAKIGLLNGSLSLEGPLIRQKASAIITARRSWLDLLWRPFDNSLGVDYYDINAKVNYILNASNRLYISFYNGRDQFRVKDEETSMRARWGNTFAALKWNTILTPKVFIHTTATYSAFRYSLRDAFYYQVPDSSGNLQMYKGLSTITERSLRTQLYWYVAPKHKVEIGLRYTNSTFNPASVTYGEGFMNLLNPVSSASRFHSNEMVLHAEDEFEVGEKWKFRIGAHWANWFSKNFNYTSFQPRVYLSYQLNPYYLLQASGSRMAQFLHLLSNNTSGFPTDFWLPSTAAIKPETSTMATLGIKSHREQQELSFSAELYYKKQENLVTYRGGASIFDNIISWEDKLVQGEGWSYGAEFSIDKQMGPFSAGIVYTLSRSRRKFERLNGGKAFPYRFDRRHNLKIDCAYKVSKKVQFTACWTYMSGEAITLPDQVYPDFDNNLLNSIGSYGLTYNYTGWNNYRLPSVHRLDMMVSFTRKKKKKYERTLSIGIYNAYGRKNIVGTSFGQGGDDGSYILEGYSIGRFIPAVSYRVQF